jgi:DNA-binding transcriptional ArsR family regulator
MHRARANSDVFHAVADPTRRAILDRLRNGPAPVNAILRDFPQSRPAISRHLRVLREARVVVEQRNGRERVYRIQPGDLRRVATWIESYRSFWQSSLENLKTYLEEER